MNLLNIVFVKDILIFTSLHGTVGCSEGNVTTNFHKTGSWWCNLHIWCGGNVTVKM